jgi:exodeoxyribonuclease V alpha subunit
VSKILKCNVKIKNKIYPKNKIQTGDWGVVEADILEVLEDSDIKPTVKNIKLIGNFPEIIYDLKYKVIASEKNNKYGKSYEIEYIASNMELEKKEDKEIFLKSILTDKEFDSLYSKLDSPFDIIKKEDAQSLMTVKGIGAAKASRLIEKYKENIDNSKIFIELKNIGLSKNIISKFLDFYKNPDIVVKKIKENPYILVDDVDGIGFKKADEIALSNGIDENSIFRVKSFILYNLKEYGKSGHSFLYSGELMYDIKQELGGNIDKKIIKQSAYELKKEGRLWWSEDKQRIALKYFYDLEKNISREVKRILNSDNTFEFNDWESKIKSLEIKQGWSFTDEQLNFIKLGLNENFVMLCGSAGCGKTVTVNALVNILNKYESIGVALAGKAADRLSEVTDCETMTVHRALEYKNKKFVRNKENPLFYDIIILDEASMMGGHLFYSLIQSLKTGGKVIIIGDDGQLEAIGECNIFSDLLRSKIPKVKLTKIHRQAKKSAIITKSIEIRDGRQITDEVFYKKEKWGELQDFTIDTHKDSILTAPKIMKYFKDSIEKKDIMDIQIITPMRYRGGSSVFELNQLAQNIYNPNTNKYREVTKNYKKYKLKEKDKIIIRKNNYKIINKQGQEYPIYNGNTGIIEKIDNALGEYTIRLKNNVRVIVPFSFSMNIELGYAITVHSSQGSQFETVIGGIDFNAYSLLTRELLYTLITRASKECILCAENKAIRYAIDTSYISEKQTFLKEFL